jgi:peptidoglycan hydrolase-like protein with peptidoglycan-binding domain
MIHMPLPADGYPILKQGATGLAVQVLQRRINQRFAEFGAMAPFVKVNGVFDHYMTSMVRYLQCIAFLPMDGIVGLQTWDFLLNGVESLPILALGSCGAMVWQIQDTLRRLGAPTKVDGVFEWQCVQQIKHYQKLNDLPPLGVIDRSTWACLIRERGKTPDGSWCCELLE